MKIMVALIILVFSISELDAKKKKRTRVKYKNKTDVEFGGDSIEGDFKKPEGFYMIHRATTEFKEIVKFDLRFKSKITKSVGYLE
jgi:hypothetical protein